MSGIQTDDWGVFIVFLVDLSIGFFGKDGRVVCFFARALEWVR